MTDSRVASLAALLREWLDREPFQPHDGFEIWTADFRARVEAELARGEAVGSRLGEPSPAEIDALAREVWKSWRAGMAVQNRPVAVERTSWDTLSAEDRELDHYIAGWLLSFLNYKSGVRAGSEEPPLR